ncbi:MAG: hypothetical protein IJC75_01005 [Oscillospiraceae bacterium]|nr:hypothetical protein [Oscillospiraceae bacterium]
MKVPTHLRQIAVPENDRLRLQCPCGCGSFLLYRNGYSPEEQAVLDAYEAECSKLLRHGTICGKSDADGTVHIYRRRFGLFRQEIVLPERPFFADITVIKAICAECNTEHLLFDNRLHGYDALTEQETIPYTVTLYRPMTKKPCIIWIQLEWDDDPDAFGWIGIGVSSSANGKMRRVFDAETA